MGVDFYPCSNCGETFPDCGEYHICDQEHILCSYCMRNVPEARETDDNNWFDSRYCPTCAKGGSERQRLTKALAALEEIQSVAGESNSTIGYDRILVIARKALAGGEAVPVPCAHSYEQIGPHLVCSKCQDGWPRSDVP